MTDYRIELQAFVDAAASFTEPALGHHKAWAEAVARARNALSMPESSASTVCPITPPPELLAQWEDDILDSRDNVDYVLDCAWRNGFQAGADQELEACCEWLSARTGFMDAHDLRAARRPKPPSLKELALEALDNISIASFEQDAANTIRRALETLDD